MLDALIPTPRLVEVDRIEVAAPPEEVWQALRHGNLAEAPLIRALFWLRALPGKLRGTSEPSSLCIDDLRSTPETPGFSVLAESPPHGFAVGAIGKVWQGQIPFVHVADATAFEAFEQAGFVKVAWSISIHPFSERCSRIELEVRVDATDDASWAKFRTYFKLIGPGSHFIRRVLLSSLVERFGPPQGIEAALKLAGDELLPDAQAQVSQAVTIMAAPQQIWPWLLQMGCHRAGYYSYDLLDNAGVRSSRELIPELTVLTVGQVIPATPESAEGFEVLSLQAPHQLVLGGLYDNEAGKQLPFAAARPEHFWQVTWAFELERVNHICTRLHVRARAEFPASGRLHASWIRPVHRLMQSKMLHELAARVEGRLPRDDLRDVVSGIGGAAVMLAAMATPFLRPVRSHWGVTTALAQQRQPGDQLVPEPTWAWTHGVEIDAPADRVWRWVAQLGADRGGFYSYQWLENLVGCELRNADAVHPEWELRPGDSLVLHPKAPSLRIEELERGRYFVAHAPREEAAAAAGKPWAQASWLLAVEPLSTERCRLLSRYRLACSADLATRLALGPTFVEPISFAMDRRMLLGIKALSERDARFASPSLPELTRPAGA
jgi:hypothetical protein